MDNKIQCLMMPDGVSLSSSSAGEYVLHDVPILAACCCSVCSVASSTQPWYCHPNSTPRHRSSTLTFLPYVAAPNHPVSFPAPTMLPCTSRSVHCISEKRSPTNSNLPQYNAQQARSPRRNPLDRTPDHQAPNARNHPCTSPTSKGNAESAPESIQTVDPQPPPPPSPSVSSSFGLALVPSFVLALDSSPAWRPKAVARTVSVTGRRPTKSAADTAARRPVKPTRPVVADAPTPVHPLSVEKQWE